MKESLRTIAVFFCLVAATITAAAPTQPVGTLLAFEPSTSPATNGGGGDDTCSGAIAASVPSTELMSIDDGSDVNWRVFTVTERTLIRVETTGDPATDDTALALYGDCLEGFPDDLLFSNDALFGALSGFQLCLDPGDYYVEVSGGFDLNEVPGTPDDFNLEITSYPDVSCDDSPLSILNTETGLITLSVDGAGTNDPAGTTFQVRKPTSVATVRRAFLAGASNFYHIIQDGDVVLDGSPVNWDQSVVNQPSFAFFNNVVADVTSLVATTLNDADPPVGLGEGSFLVNIPVVETNADNIVLEGADSALIDGLALYVIFDNPIQGSPNTATILFGAQDTLGDTFTFSLTEPLGPGDTALFGLGISFSYQGGENSGETDCGADADMFSIIGVNEERLTSCAGGTDDGNSSELASDGNLITVGGVGDDPANPTDPFQEAGDGSEERIEEDELYDLAAVLEPGVTLVEVSTLNPSDDDNIFTAYFFTEPAIVAETLTLIGDATERVTGTQHSVTAQIVNNLGFPVVGRTVSFSVTSGPNAETEAEIATDGTGQAVFTYTGSQPGTDVIEASFTDFQDEPVSDSVQVTWFPPCVDTDEDGYGAEAGNPFCPVPLTADCDDADPFTFPGAEELCDSRDNDCDESVDEDVTRVTTCGLGLCSGNTGIETCVDGMFVNDTCDPFAGASLEICSKGADDDCDGLSDEDVNDQVDADEDGIPGACDNCFEDFNPDQDDSDNDGEGNACDPLNVSDITPAPGALEVPVSTNISVAFREPVYQETVDVNTFIVSVVLPPEEGQGEEEPAYAGEGVVPGVISVAADGLSATFDPVDALATGTVYEVDLTDGIEDEGGRALIPLNSTFGTEATPAGEEPLPEVSEESEGLDVGSNTGASTASAGDVNNDGLGDFLAGAPSFEADRGAVGLYLGSVIETERVTADVIFRGQPGDRAGRAVFGGVDATGDGLLDVIIGAPADDVTPETPGRVYVFSFDPNDTANYPNLGDPSIADTVDLSLVGTAALPGLVIEGVCPGDLTGFAVTAGGNFGGGSDAEIIIGTPGRDVGAVACSGGEADAGSVFVIFDQPGLMSPLTLDRVANGLGDQVDGTIFEGESAGDGLGWAVAVPGNVCCSDAPGSSGNDLAFTSPFADTTPTAPPPGSGAAPNQFMAADAGVAYVVEGSNPLPVGIIEVCVIGDPSGGEGATTFGTQIHGDQAGEQLGYSVAGGGNNRLDPDGAADLLVGAPGYDTPIGTGAALEAETSAGVPETLATRPGGEAVPLIPEGVGGMQPDTGFAAQTGELLPLGIIEVCAVGDPTEGATVSGVLWHGAESGDRLGTAVAGIGDVNGDGLDDIALGAPFADAQVPDGEAGPTPTGGFTGIPDAGAVYQIDGAPEVGVIEVCAIGGETPGRLLTGDEPNEQAGTAIAATLNLDGDSAGNTDFIIGAPNRDAVTGDLDTGTVYQILESEPPPPGTCGPDGCSVADLDSGALLVVPEGSIEQPTGPPAAQGVPALPVLEIEGILDEDELPLSPPEGLALLGAVDLRPVTLTLAGPAARVFVPVRSVYDAQLEQDETFDLYILGAGEWLLADVDVLVEESPLFPGRASTKAEVSTLAFYAVFIGDLDGDLRRDSIDFDADGDSMDTLLDNCPMSFNPDQLDSDSDTSGDLCDVCPAYSNERCDVDRTAAVVIGAQGGTLVTPDASVEVVFAAGSVNDDSSVSLTGRTGPFSVRTGTLLYSVVLEPSGLALSPPATLTMKWDDADNDGVVDGTAIDEADLVLFLGVTPLTDACQASPSCDAVANSFTVSIASGGKFTLGVPGAPLRAPQQRRVHDEVQDAHRPRVLTPRRRTID